MRSGLPYGNASAAIWPYQARVSRRVQHLRNPCPNLPALAAPTPLGSLLGLQVLQHASIKLTELPQTHSAPVVVLNSNNPDADLIGLGVGGVMQSPGARVAHVAGMDMARFMAHLGRMGTLLLL